MTFLELCQRLRQEVGAAGNGPSAVTSQNGEYKRIVDWVVQAWREIQLDRERWFFAWAQGSVAVTTEFRDYSPPSDFQVWDGDTLYLGSQKLQPMAWEKFKTQHREDSQAAVPTAITQLPNGNFRLDTTPKQAGLLTLDYYRTPQSLSDAIDIPRLPVDYHMLIVYRAMFYYALYENAQEVISAAQLGERQMMNDLITRHHDPVTLGGPLA